MNDLVQFLSGEKNLPASVTQIPWHPGKKEHRQSNRLTVVVCQNESPRHHLGPSLCTGDSSVLHVNFRPPGKGEECQERSRDPHSCRCPADRRSTSNKLVIRSTLFTWSVAWVGLVIHFKGASFYKDTGDTRFGMPWVGEAHATRILEQHALHRGSPRQSYPATQSAFRTSGNSRETAFCADEVSHVRESHYRSKQTLDPGRVSKMHCWLFLVPS